MKIRIEVEVDDVVALRHFGYRYGKYLPWAIVDNKTRKGAREYFTHSIEGALMDLGDRSAVPEGYYTNYSEKNEVA